MKQVFLYTDGSARGNPGPGGFGAILFHNQHRRELSGGFALTTNNRMELLAAITGLESLNFPLPHHRLLRLQIPRRRHDQRMDR